MSYKDGSWGKQAKLRSKRRREYFREYRRRNPQKANYKQKANYNKINRSKSVGSDDSTGIIGEKLALKFLAESKWVGDLYDMEWKNKKIDVKTSKPIKFRQSFKWKFSLERQKSKVDYFILFCLRSSNQLEGMYVIPDKEITVKNISIVVGSKSKYDKYKLIPLL